MNLKNLILFALLSSAIIFSASCTKDKDDKPTPKEPVKVVSIKDLPADPATRSPSDGSIIGGDNTYTFFRFSDSTIVPNSDSASNKWDIGFRGTDIIINGGVNGPGNVTGQVVKNTLEEVETAPDGNYKEDEAGGAVFSDWFNYNMEAHLISPKPGYILIIHTNDDKYVKMEITSYYKGSPASPTTSDDMRYYTFRYVIQPDGSKRFKN